MSRCFSWRMPPRRAGGGGGSAEPLLLLLGAGAVALADREPADPKAALAAGTLAGLAALAKTTGMCAVLGVPLSLWLPGRRRGGDGSDAPTPRARDAQGLLAGPATAAAPPECLGLRAARGGGRSTLGLGRGRIVPAGAGVGGDRRDLHAHHYRLALHPGSVRLGHDGPGGGVSR